jgi:hypothetical protein
LWRFGKSTSRVWAGWGESVKEFGIGFMYDIGMEK